MTTATEDANKTAKPSKVSDKFAAIRSEMNEELVERSTETDLVVRMLLARVHGVLLGSWGVAKSMLIREMLTRIDGAKLFETLLTKNAPAEQVVGPISLQALKQDRFKRIITDKLPEANVAFIDEIFKSNATVLNNLLSIINERKFHNDTVIDLPDFWTVYGASNELPEEQREELGAFYDRLAVRLMVEPVRTSDGIKSVLRGQIAREQGNKVASNVTMVTLDEIKQAQNEVKSIGVPEKVLDTLVELHTRASGEGMEFSLRRMGEGVKLMKANAWLRGSNEVVPEDARVYEHLMWDDPEDRKLAYELTLEFAGSVAKKANQIRGEYEEVQKELNDLQSQMPTDGSAPSGDLVGQIGRVSIMFKTLSERTTKAVSDAKDEGHDTHELGSLSQDIETSKSSLNQMLGMDV